MRGDIKASELYQDREFLTRVGLGIYDVEFSNGSVGFEDVRRFAYVEDEGEDAKLYRRKVFNLIGHYYPNDLARVLWARFNEYQAHLQSQEGFERSLEECARQWLDRYGHGFFKTWTLEQSEVPTRMRNQAAELRLGWLDLLAVRLAPQWRELVEAGFKLPSIFLTALLVRRTGAKRGYEHYLRLVASLSGLPIKDMAEAGRRKNEIANLRRYLSNQLGTGVGLRPATIEYYRRLTLLAEIETAHQTEPAGLPASAC